MSAALRSVEIKPCMSVLRYHSFTVKGMLSEWSMK